MSFRFFAALLALIFQWHTAKADCPLKLEASSDVATGYTQRGTHCEGLFRQPVAASASLRIVGFHKAAPAYEPGSGRELIVTAAQRQKSSSVALRILSTKARQYYRLDATLDGKGQFAWPRTLIDHPRIRLEPSHAKALACDKSCEGSALRIYPVAIVEQGKSAPASGVTLWLRAGADLDQLRVTVSSSDKKVTKPIMDNTDVLAGRTLFAGVPQEIFLPIKAGSYRMKALAVPKGNSAMDEVQAELVVD
jgi:hypothetical protein